MVLRPRIAGRRALAPLAALAAIFVAVTLLPSAAHADPAVEAGAAQAQLQALADKAEILVEKYDAGKDQLSAAQVQLSAEHEAITVAQRTVDTTQLTVDAIASAAYKSGGLENVESVLLAPNPQLALQGADTLARLAADRGRQLAQATTARNALAQAQASAVQTLAGVQVLQASLAGQQKTLDALIAKQQSALKVAQAAANAATAVASDVTKIEVSRAKTRVALTAPKATAPKAAAPKAAAPVQSAPVQTVAAPAALVGDTRAAAAVRYAYAQLGKPYRYGASGAQTFDCSGLTMKAWAAAGVALGHNAAGQYGSTKHVARNALQPGDLVYFGSPIHHVGIYIGGDKFIEAPYTGADVQVSTLSNRQGYAGASRP
jgi:cell wall-associated NlpC family hydrolase